MTPERFNQCLAMLGWSIREVARQLGAPPTRPRYWSEGRYPIPDAVARWLEHLAAAHERYPPPDL